jgi:hypothetical protein
MGEMKRFDANPKRWRVVAALCLDAASFTEILAPLVLGSLVLPTACAANVLKNIGFLTSSASRAALHQSLALSSNLADVTAKSGSQSVAAGLLGTGLGIGLSLALEHDVGLFLVAFGGLVVVHQGCTYWSLSAVGLRHLNKHRLYLLLRAFVQSEEDRVVLSPLQVAEQEVFFPWVREDDTDEWLRIGSDLVSICPGGPTELQELLLDGELPYILSSKTAEDGRIHLTFLRHASGEDLILGMLHAVLLRQELVGSAKASNDSLVERTTVAVAKERLPELLAAMHQQGWMTGSNETSIEPSGAFRLEIRQSD